MSNQASEDDLKQYLHEMHHRIMGDYAGDPYDEHPYQDEAKPYFWEDEAKRLQQLIRTEKLKLLAEVRERVVGEDELYATDEAGWGVFASNREKMHANKVKSEQRTALAKLEAEL